MNDLPKIGIRVDGSMTPAECVEFAKAADAAGFAGIWFAENAFARGILPAAAACAVATRNIRINAGVFNPYSRHPTMMAMEIGALDELSNGRTSLSVGAGIMSATEKMALSPDKPLRALRDTLVIVRDLLQGNEVDYSGPAFSAKNVKLDYRPRKSIPIYLAGRGDLTMKLAGECADGLLVSNMCSVEFARHAAELMRSSARAARRTTLGEVVRYMPCAVHSQSHEALNAAKLTIGEMLPRFWSLGQKLSSAKGALLAGTGISETEFANSVSRLRAGEDPSQVLDERYVSAFALAGTPGECVSLVRRYKAMGIDECALTFSGSRAKSEIVALGAALSTASRVN